MRGSHAKVLLTARSAQVNIVQHTGGVGKSLRSMLDLSASGLSDVVDTNSGWLDADGSMHFGDAPAGCDGAHKSPEDRLC